MNKYKKSAFILFSACVITVLSSCHRGSGCPTFGKVQHEQSAKKSV